MLCLLSSCQPGSEFLVYESREVMVLSSENVMPLTTLLESSINELQRFRSKASSDEHFTLEILRRALVEQTDEAWPALQQCFSEIIRVWIRCHPSSDVALLRDTEENYVAQTFSRFWYAAHQQRIAFTTLPAALSYLHATLNGVIIDTLRSHLRLCSREVPFPASGLSHEPSASVEDPLESEGVWESIQTLLCNERERRIFYLLYICGLKPREIVIHCPEEFAEVKEIYRLNQNIIGRLHRNRDRLRYLLGSDE
jgi:hypothetical protein